MLMFMNHVAAALAAQQANEEENSMQQIPNENNVNNEKGTGNYYRFQDIEAKLSRMSVYPLDVLVVGGTGCGKSSTLNSILQQELARVGYGCDPETMDIQSFKINEKFRMWDSPGLGDGKEADDHHKRLLFNQLMDTYCTSGDSTKYGLIDLVLVVIDGSGRDLGTITNLLNEVIVPNFQKNRILIAINQADAAMKGRHWDAYNNCPDYTLLRFLEDKASSVQDRVYEATGVKVMRPIYYSAEKNFNVHKLLDLIIDNIPHCRRRIYEEDPVA